MENKKIKKINWVYFIGYIIVPILVMLLCIALTAYKILPNNGFGMAIFMVGIFGPFLFWGMGGNFIFGRQKKKMTALLDAENFHRNQTFSGRGVEVIVDTVDNKVALKFFWNPFETYVVDASRVTNAYVDDGKMGKGFMAGSSRVSFLFQVDGVKIRVNTFSSNQRFRMDSEYILNAISKADMMVEILTKASEGKK